MPLAVLPVRRVAASIVRTLILLPVLTGGNCFSQIFNDGLCNLVKEVGFSAPSYTTAYEVLDAIGKVVPFQTHTIILWPTDRVDQYGGAAATMCGDPPARYIFFDQGYIDQLKKAGESDPRLFVLAHEAAHHINGDTLNGTPTKDKELAADRAAAMWLIRLGVTDEELIETFTTTVPRTQGSGYPTFEERLAVVEEAIRSEHSMESAAGGRLKIDWPTEYVSLGETVTVRVAGGGTRGSSGYSIRLTPSLSRPAGDPPATSSALSSADEFPSPAALPTGLSFQSTGEQGMGKIVVDKKARPGDVLLDLYVRDSGRGQVRIFRFPVTLKVRLTVDVPPDRSLSGFRTCLSDNYGVVLKNADTRLECQHCGDQKSPNFRQEATLWSNAAPVKLFPTTTVDDPVVEFCYLLNQNWTRIYDEFQKP